MLAYNYDQKNADYIDHIDITNLILTLLKVLSTLFCLFLLLLLNFIIFWNEKLDIRYASDLVMLFMKISIIIKIEKHI